MSRAPSTEMILVGYRYGPTLVDVEADDPEAARWLTEFLTPWFEVGAPGKDEFTVRLTCSTSTFAVLERRQATATPNPAACFALDSQVVSLPSWQEDGGTLIADAECGCFYLVRGRSVEVVSQPGVRRVRIGLMRVVRELAAACVLAQESVLDFHAAAFTVGEKAVLLVGPKGAGKTTLLANALASRRASLLANDRVFVDTNHDPGYAFGVPTLVSLRAGTLQLFPNLRRDFPERPALLHAAELKSHDVGRFEDDNAPHVFALSPAQFAGRLGATTVRCAPIGVIVFPEISPTVDRWSLDRIDPTDGAARLRECLYGARTTPRFRTLFEELAGRDRAKPATLVDQLAAQLPLFSCRLGPNAYRNGADAWLRALSLKLAGKAWVA